MCPISNGTRAQSYLYYNIQHGLLLDPDVWLEYLINKKDKFVPNSKKIFQYFGSEIEADFVTSKPEVRVGSKRRILLGHSQNSI